MKFRLVPASLVSLALILALTSCHQNNTPAPTLVAGQFADLTSTEFCFFTGDKEFWAVTDEEGNFRMELDLARDHYLQAIGVNFYPYLVAGDSLYIKGNAFEPETLEFSEGQSGDIMRWYRTKDEYLGTLLDTVNIQNYYSQDAQSFKDLNAWIIGEFHEQLDRHCKEHPGIGDDFIALEKENIAHYWYYELNVYHLENPAYTGKNPEFPGDFYNYLERVRLNDTLLFEYPGYRYFLYSWLDLQVDRQSAGQKGVELTHLALDIAQENFEVPHILAEVAWEKIRLQNSRLAVDEEVLARAASLGIPEKELEEARAYMTNLQALAPGKAAPDFEVLDRDGNTSRLEDFRGSYLLMDLWSHTCGPCLREMPRLEEIRHELEGKAIQVIAICLSAEEPWKNKIQDMGFSWDGQYRADEGWSSEFVQAYLRGSGVPVYVLIDPEGRIVNARMPYPSQGMRQVLEDLPM